MKLFLFFILSVNVIFADITGVGYGSTIQEAKKEALADISTQIGASVDSSFSSSKIAIGSEYSNEKRHDINVQSSYPIKGVEFSSYAKTLDNKIKISAYLKKSKAFPIYSRDLKSTQAEIIQLWNRAKKSTGEKKQRFLESAIEKYNYFISLSTVARYFEINIPMLNITKVELETELTSIEFNKKDVGFNRYSDSLTVQIKTEPNKKTFKLYDEVEIFVKVSKPAYFYIINHSIKTEKSSVSSLLDFNENSGIYKFIEYISEANQWQSLGSFEIYPPLGAEFIQVVASSKKFKIKDLPEYKYDSESEFYILKENGVIPNIKKARMIRKKKPFATAKLEFKTTE